MKRRPAYYFPYLVVGICLAILAYGLALFPDAPLHACGVAFCGKQGQPHTYGDYDAFRHWETLLAGCWPLGLGAAVFLHFRKKRERAAAASMTTDKA